MAWMSLVLHGPGVLQGPVQDSTFCLRVDAQQMKLFLRNASACAASGNHPGSYRCDVWTPFPRSSAAKTTNHLQISALYHTEALALISLYM